MQLNLYRNTKWMREGGPTGVVVTGIINCLLLRDEDLILKIIDAAVAGGYLQRRKKFGVREL